TYSWSSPFGSKPDASLVDSCGKEVIHHFGAVFGGPPLWKSIADGSSVQGAKLASVPKAGTIPWLLLKGTPSLEADGAAGLVSSVDYIQRLDTSGGAAPDASTCTAIRVGETNAVTYAADYYFYTDTDASH
ncbi:MAG TPA: DUF3455 domain-containing protein, partial [Polyangiaceae bacterium]|nr:DUF3455 domain-containing protein [Polyangiaceae bacterium]